MILGLVENLRLDDSRHRWEAWLMKHTQAFDLVRRISRLFVLVVCRIIPSLLFDQGLEEIKEITLLLSLRLLLTDFGWRSL